MTPFDYWRRGVRLPLTLFAITAVIIAVTNADLVVARWLFFDSLQMRWRGADSWWMNEFVHSGGGWLVRCIILGAVGLWVATFIRDGLLRWRRPAAYFLISTLLTVGIVGALKQLTNVDCPWDLAPFGGRFPYIPLFADRPNALGFAHCFPAAHAGSGYALMAAYFVGSERGRRWARAGLAVGVSSGLIFGLAQQSRGAHFLSHDLSSAMLAWCISLSVYCGAFRCQVWSPAANAYANPHPDTDPGRGNSCAGAPALINMT